MNFDNHPILFLFWIFIAMVLLTCGIAYGIGSVNCSDIAEQSGLETEYSFYSGCYVKLEDKWVPVERWRNIQ